MAKSANLEKLSENGIKFNQIDFVVEIFPAPLPEEISDMEIETESDLFRMSAHEGYYELYVPSDEKVSGESEDKTYEFKRFDFLKWQLIRCNNETIYHLMNKTGFYLPDILDPDEEYEKDNDYDPDSWLNSTESDTENFSKGIALIQRLKDEHAEIFYTKLIEALLDPDYGVFEFLETEINDNLSEVRELYKNWDQPLMIVSRGRFFPYIEADFQANLMMDDYRLEHMWVRNNDEGDI